MLLVVALLLTFRANLWTWHPWNNGPYLEAYQNGAKVFLKSYSNLFPPTERNALNLLILILVFLQRHRFEQRIFKFHATASLQICNKDKVWVVTVFWVARTHLACPDLGPHADVCAPPIWRGRTSHPHTFGKLKNFQLYLDTFSAIFQHFWCS